MLMDFFIIISEILAVFSLLLFCCVLDSRYYEARKIRHVTRLLWLPIVLLVVILFSSEDSGKLENMCIHIAYNVCQISLLAYACKKLVQLRIRSMKRYLAAQFALCWGIIFEVITCVLLGIIYLG